MFNLFYYNKLIYNYYAYLFFFKFTRKLITEDLDIWVYLYIKWFRKKKYKFYNYFKYSITKYRNLFSPELYFKLINYFKYSFRYNFISNNILVISPNITNVNWSYNFENIFLFKKKYMKRRKKNKKNLKAINYSINNIFTFAYNKQNLNKINHYYLVYYNYFNYKTFNWRVTI